MAGESASRGLRLTSAWAAGVVRAHEQHRGRAKGTGSVRRRRFVRDKVFGRAAFAAARGRLSKRMRAAPAVVSELGVNIDGTSFRNHRKSPGSHGSRARVRSRCVARTRCPHRRGEPSKANDSPQRAPLGWGLGFYQGGEVLHAAPPHRRARRSSTWRGSPPTCGPTCSSATCGWRRWKPCGPENTHPFRYRQWPVRADRDGLRLRTGARTPGRQRARVLAKRHSGRDRRRSRVSRLPFVLARRRSPERCHGRGVARP